MMLAACKHFRVQACAGFDHQQLPKMNDNSLRMRFRNKSQPQWRRQSSMPKSAPGCGVVVAGGSCPRCCRGGAGGAGAFNGVQVLGALGLAVGGEDFNASAFPFKKVLLASSRFQTQYGFATVGDLVPAQHLTTPKTPLN
jgi:hypothetical protein